MNLVQRFTVFLLCMIHENEADRVSSIFDKCLPLFSVYFSSSSFDLCLLIIITEGFYATNNQFQKAGPKGFVQVKVLENDNLYVRVDLPGVPDDAVRYRVDAVRQKVVFFSGETLNNGKEGVRQYSGTAGLGCDCCEITGVDAKMKDGVLRMILTRVKVVSKAQDNNNNKCTLTVPPFTGSTHSSSLKSQSLLLHHLLLIQYSLFFIKVNPEYAWRIIRVWCLVAREH